MLPQYRVLANDSLTEFAEIKITSSFAVGRSGVGFSSAPPAMEIVQLLT
jgi:hypothetical protein